MSERPEPLGSGLLLLVFLRVILLNSILCIYRMRFCLKEIPLVLGITLWSVGMLSQTADVIRTGRPGQSIGAFSIGEGIFQSQNGINFNRLEGSRDREFILNNNVFRFGLSEPFEISAVVDFFNEFDDKNPRTGELGGTNIQLGARYHLMDQKGIIPNVAIQSRTLFYNAGELEFNTISILSTSNRFAENYVFVTNWKMVTRDGRDAADFAYIFYLERSLGNRWGTFIEMYGGLNEFTTFFDTGLSYLVNDDLQLDMYGGVQNNDGVEDYFIEAGLSWRLMPN